MEGKYPSLEGKNVIVIGAGGIGGAVVGDFLRQGSNVYALDKKPPEELEKVWNDYYGEFENKVNLEVYQADVTYHEGLKKTIRKIGEKTKPEGIVSMVYTAGIGESIDVRDFEDGFPEELFKLNVCGFIYAVREVVPYMKKGSITVIGSLNASRPEPHMALYDSTKAALTQFTRTAAIDLGPEIRVNVVAPGYIRTPQTIEELNNSEAKKTIVDNTILKRVGTPEDISAVVVALASNDFSYATGSVIPVDGGLALAQYPPIEKQKNM